MHVRRFLELTKRAGLVQQEALRAALSRLTEQHGGRLPSDATAVARHLVQEGLLTDWQVSKLLDGKYQGFFLGKYRLLSHLGSGGMSSVYLAEHTVLHRLRAIKVLPRKRLHESSYLDRFLLEARATAKLDHPNIVRAYDVDQDGDTYFIVMEYVTGQSMQQLVRRSGPLAPERVARYIGQAARGLHHAHRAGLVHRDIKPANLLVTDDDQVKVLDLGLALLADEQRSSVTLAHSETVLGTADYLAPEQAVSSHNVDFRADIYSLGCTMYCLIVGHPPFQSGSLAQRLAMHQSQPPPPIASQRSDCPEALQQICMRMLEKSPDDRYQSAEEVADDLQRWLERGESPAWSPRVEVSVGVAADGKSADHSAVRRTGRQSTRRRRMPPWRGWLGRVASWRPFRQDGDRQDADTLSATDGGTDKAGGRSSRIEARESGSRKTARISTEPTGPVGVPLGPSTPADESGRIELGIEVFSGSGSYSHLKRRRRRSTSWWLIILVSLASLGLLVGLIYLLVSLQ